MEKNIFIIEPLWNSSQLVQEVGHAIRSNEHSNILLSSEESRNVNVSISCNKPEDEFGTFYKIKLLYKNTIVIPNYRTTHFEKVVEYHLSKKNNNYYYYKFTDNELVYMSNEFRTNHMVKNIYHIIQNIEKLSYGKIKKYMIFTQLELEILCDYLKKNNILHRIKIQYDKDKTYDRYFSYDEYYFIDKGMYFNRTGSNYETNKIMNIFELYVEVYKGFVDLCKKSDIKNPKYGIYLDSNCKAKSFAK